ncbi:MAG: DUF4838 domain-containing protein [Clostridia bacterium]|nr:DUF4838 domain-containing protein [Clostridia bacterium]
MKKFIKILCLTLATVFLLSATACKDSSKDSNGSGGSNAVGGLNPTNANHYAKNQIRDEYIVYNGQSDYILVIPKDASNYEKQASSLITEYLYKACGVNMITVTDDTVYDANGKYISLGDTTLMRRSGIAVPESRFGSAGFRIVTKGDIIYISGSRHWMRKGTYYGAQEFLFHTIGWKAYTDTEIIYEERSSIKMVNFDVTEIPDFDTRIIGYDTVYFNKAYRDLLRLNANAKDDGTAIPYYAHSHFEVLPPEIYYQDHPEWYWYTEGGKKVPYSADIHSKFWRYGQLCLSNPKVIEKSIEVLTAQFLTYTTATMVHLGIMDNLYKCKCETCTKFMSDNDTNYAGINVYYTNQVARGVTENMKKLDPTRKLIFRMFAYYATIEPPVNLVNGEYVPDSELVVPDKNVYVQFTPLDADGLETLDHGKNTKHYEYFKGWCSLTNNLAVWKYNTNFYRYFISNKNWDITAEDFRMYYKAGATTMYDQGPLTDSILQMKEMRLYVESKLMWNTQYS